MYDQQSKVGSIVLSPNVTALSQALRPSSFRFVLQLSWGKRESNWISCNECQNLLETGTKKKKASILIKLICSLQIHECRQAIVSPQNFVAGITGRRSILSKTLPRCTWRDAKGVKSLLLTILFIGITQFGEFREETLLSLRTVGEALHRESGHLDFREKLSAELI